MKPQHALRKQNRIQGVAVSLNRTHENVRILYASGVYFLGIQACAKADSLV